MAYATVAKLMQVGVNADALTGIPEADLQAALDDASATADGYLAARYVLPLVAPFPGDLQLRICEIAAFLAVAARGLDPEGAHKVIRLRYEDALRWLRDVSNNHVQPAVTDSRPSTSSLPPRVLSGKPRGW